MTSLREQMNNNQQIEYQESQIGMEFIVPCCIIGTFILFAIVPDLFTFLYYRINGGFSNILFISIKVVYSLGYLLDALIYIFSLSRVKKVFVCCKK